MRILLGFCCVIAMTSVALGGKLPPRMPLDSLPDVDPEQHQPGMASPRLPSPEPTKRVIVRQEPSPPPVRDLPPGPPPSEVVYPGYPVPEQIRHARLYDGYRGPRPVYRPYYQPQRIDPIVGLVLGFVAGELIPAILNRRY